MKKEILVALLLSVTPGFAEAASFVKVVTPATISDQPLQFRVGTEFYEDNTVRFEIFVSSGASDISPFRDARFTVWGEHPKARPEVGLGARPITNRPVSLAVSSVKEENLIGTLRYEVQVHRSLLPQVSLTFLNYESSGMPAFDGYEFMLGQFVMEEE